MYFHPHIRLKFSHRGNFLEYHKLAHGSAVACWEELVALRLIHTRDTGIRFANEGNKRNKEASGAVHTTIPVSDTYEILKSSRSGWSAASIL
jgi:hypothetical protein